jgi:predicted transcriptional regulator
MFARSIYTEALEAIVVVDEENRFRGVVGRNRILSQMMALAKGAKAHPSA